MAIRSILEKKQLRNAEDGGSGGTGDANQNQNQNQQGDKNNTDDNLHSFDDMWSTNTDDDDQQNNSGNDNSNANSNANANETFQAHIDSLDFVHGVDISATMQALQNGDAETFGKTLQQLGANAYRNALVDANKVAQQQAQKMADNVKLDVSSQQATSAVISEMNAALPFTKQSAYAPIAKLTLTQFLNKGLSREEAIKKTGAYFKNLAGQIGNKSNDLSRRPGGGFNNVNSSNQSGNNNSGEPDWMEVLGGPAN